MTLPLKKRIGFIGFGRVVEWHLEKIKNLNIEIKFICDISEEKIEYAKKFISNAYFFNDIKSLLSNKLLEVDYCVIATPSGDHFETARKIIESGKSWGLLIEKPTFLSCVHFKKAQSWNANIIPIFQNRYNKAVIKAEEIIKNGELGDIYYASLSLDWCRPQRYYDQADWRGKWLTDGGVSTNQGIHYFDITRHLLGNFLNVRASMRRLAVNIECEDYLSALFNLNNKIPLDVRMSTAGRHTNEVASLSINGSLGNIKLHGVCCNKLTADIKNQDIMSYDEEVKIAYGNGHRDFFKLITEENMLENISLPTLSESFDTMKYIYAAYESAISGKISYAKEYYENMPLGNLENKIISFND